MKSSSQPSSFWYRNGLSLTLIALMLLFWAGQFVTGWKEHNDELEEQHVPALNAGQYLRSGHFMSATFENWESEFLQMGLYVLLTVWLRQKGSAESKKLKGEAGEEEEAQEETVSPTPEAPWPVRKGGWWLKLYNHSLFIAFSLLFLLSFTFHFRGSLIDYNEQQTLKGQPVQTASEYIGTAHFWFESFQNWQSEFLAVASIVLLSVWLRQKGSPQSKAVSAPHEQTGD